MRDLKEKIIEQVSLGKITKELAYELIKGLQAKEKDTEGIAIIGMAGKFPDADNLAEFWDNLQNGVSSIRPFPESRRPDTDRHLPFELKNRVSEPYLPGGYLQEVDKMDAEFFRISPREAQLMDPYQRIFLETVYAAIEDAGYGGDGLQGSKTGVYVGRNFTDGLFYKEVMAEADPLAVTGLASSVLASRISYILNLKGPAVVLDAACSSALVGIHLACRALLEGECETAVAGGIALSLLPLVSTAVGIDSPDAAVRAFDKDANGTVWGEGVGVVILKPLSKAVQDRDRIYAVIKGSALNNNGISSGISAPNAEALEEVILSAWTNARVNPENITYIEAHGAGTQLGDAIEVKALTTAFKRYTKKKQFCQIGSLKPNIGHLVGASGIAGLIKVVLAMKHQAIPASLNYREPNQHINFIESPLEVVTSLKPWENGVTPKTAGVVSFGFNGTNCHLVLEDYLESGQASAEDLPQLIKLSAVSAKSLLELVKAYQKFLQTVETTDFANLCYSANVGRGDYRYRLAIIAGNLADLRQKVDKLAESGLTNSDNEIFSGEHRVIGYKETAGEGELTEAQKLSFSSEAVAVVKELSGNSGSVLKSLQKLAWLYVKGADLSWRDLYKEKNVRKITLPLYPYERKRFWLDGAMERGAMQADFKPTGGTPLLERVFKAPGEEIYLTDLSAVKHWIVREHRLMGVQVVPGVAYLEMMAEAAQKYSKGRAVELKNVLFVIPLMVMDNEVEAVQCIVKKAENGLEFAAVSSFGESEADSEEQWVYHAKGQISFCDIPECRQFNLDEIKERCPEIKYIPAEAYDIKGIYEMGPRWRSIQYVHVGINEALGYLELAPEFHQDLQEYSFHPALVDMSLGVGHQILQHSQEYLPFSYKAVRIYQPLPARFYSHAVKVSGEDGQETLAFNVTILDETGKVLVEIEKYMIKKVNQAELKSSEILSLLDKRKKARGTGQKLTHLTIKEDDGSLSDLEKRVATIWAESLGLTEISIYDNIYDLGGDSIIGITIGSKLSKEFNIDFPLEEIFNHPTIAGISKLIPGLMPAQKVEFFRVERRRKEK